MIEFKRNDAQTLRDEDLEVVTGGEEGYWGGTATGVTCPNPLCLYEGPHIARKYYDREGSTIKLGRLEVFCGKCGLQLQ